MPAWTWKVFVGSAEYGQSSQDKKALDIYQWSLAVALLRNDISHKTTDEKTRLRPPIIESSIQPQQH